MKAVESDKHLSRYLLGELSDQERVEIEDRYLADANFFDELLVAEDELIDGYVRGKLSRADRDLFESHFLCTADRVERVKSARALMQFADLHSAESRVSWWQRLQSALRLNSPVMGWVLAAGLMVLIIGGPLVAIQLRNLRTALKEVQAQQLAQNQREQELQQLLARQREQNEALNQSLNRVTQSLDRERSERGQLEQEVAELKERQIPSPILSLGSGITEHIRGSGLTAPTKISVPRGASFVRLRLDLLEATYDSYLIVLEDAQQHEMWRSLLQSAQAVKNRAVIVRLPARFLATGQYKLKLSGTKNNQDDELISEFPIEVIKK